MTAADLLDRLRDLGVVIRLEGGELEATAPAGALTAEIRAELKDRRAELLAYLEAGRDGPAGPADAPGPRRRPREGPVLQSFAQQRLWFLDQVDGPSPVYHMSRAFRLRGALDVEALGRALDEIVRRHEALRTTLRAEQGTPVQVARSAEGVPLPVIDLGDAPASERMELAHRTVTDRLAEPFDLASDLLVRALLVRLAPEDHVLALVVHHAVFDGWSMGIVQRELSALYEAFAAGLPSPLPEPRLQYSDYSSWQREWLLAGELERQRTYWTEQLKDAPQTLELPTDRARPPVFDARGATSVWRLPPGDVERLTALGRSEHATLFMVLLAGFGTLLHRYTGAPGVLVGSPVANRTRSELVDLVGLVTNTVVLRVDTPPGRSFRDVLRQTRHTCVGAYGNADMPFERLVEALQPERDLSRTPLVQTFFALEESGSGRDKLGDVDVAPFEIEESVARTDLSLWLRPDGGGGLRGFAEYSTGLFRAETIERLLRHFSALLESVSEDPDRPIDEVRFLPADEVSRLAEEWNATEAEAQVATVVGRIGAMVSASPDRVVAGGGGDRTYAELWERSGRMAGFLSRRGVGPGAVVGVSVPRASDMLVALLGIWRSGAAYLPLDPEFPAERLAFMVEDCGADLVIGDGSGSTWAAETVALLDAMADAPAVGEPVASSIDPEALAYVLYTSGSTGKPKGVEVCHGSLANFIQSMAAEPGLGEDDVLLAVTTLSFDISGLELWLPLWVGARVEIVDEDDARDGVALLERLRSSDATVMQATPATWRMLLEAGWAGRLGKVLCGGEPFPKDLVAPLLERADEVWNLYGPTETTVWSTVHRVESDDGLSVPIGRPIANTRVYVVGPDGWLTPQGVPGELQIGGGGVARGYRGRPELTADRFVDSPFVDGDRLYRTGDLVRWTCEGTLEHLGRLDDQVKVHGHRIELGEIEAALAEHEGVRRAMAAVKGRGGDAKLVAYVVNDSARPLIGSELRRFLRRRLPDYMIPGIITEIDTFPLTPNGKVDRRALPDPTARAARRTYVAPASESERQLADIWQSLLRVDRVSALDNFFELGGHSLLAVKAVALFQEASGSRLNPRELFFKDLRQIAEVADELGPG